MPPGPLPNPARRRRNVPTIPTTELPASGRKGAAPEVPTAFELAVAGEAWWAWAWSTPQAAGWSDGDLFAIARRASLEDDLVTVAQVEGLDLLEALGAENASQLRMVITRLAALCGGRLALFREMRDLDDRLGLTPKGLANLRWQIVDDSQELGDDAGDEYDELELGKLTVKELRALAVRRRIPIAKAAKKSELIAALELPAVVQLDDRRRRLTANAP